MDLIPITFPLCDVLDRDLYPGVGLFDVEKAFEESRPYFSNASWITLCMKIAEDDMSNLASIFEVCERLGARL